MPNYECAQIGIAGVTRSGAAVLREVEVTVGGALLLDLWENPDNPPEGVVLPLPWSVTMIDHQAVLVDDADASTPLNLDIETAYLMRVLDGAQSTPEDVIPTLRAWAAALPRS